MQLKTDLISTSPAAVIPGHRESHLVKMAEAVHRVMGFDSANHADGLKQFQRRPARRHFFNLHWRGSCNDSHALTKTARSNRSTGHQEVCCWQWRWREFNRSDRSISESEKILTNQASGNIVTPFSQTDFHELCRANFASSLRNTCRDSAGLWVKGP